MSAGVWSALRGASGAGLGLARGAARVVGQGGTAALGEERVAAFADARRRGLRKVACYAGGGLLLCVGLRTLARDGGRVLRRGGASEGASAAEVARWGHAGIVVCDEVVVERFPDEKVEGVDIYISTVRKKSYLMSALGLELWPSAASVSVVGEGVRLSDLAPIRRGPAGEDVVSIRRNMFFKSVNIRRVMDEERGTLIYTAYRQTWLAGNEEAGASSGGGARTSVDVVRLAEGWKEKLAQLSLAKRAPQDNDAVTAATSEKTP